MKFAVENFKIFKERTEFDIRPITILVGPNGSGKSSVIRAMEMLGSVNMRFMKRSEHDIKHNRDFTKLLGDSNDKVIKFENYDENSDLKYRYTIKPEGDIGLVTNIEILKIESGDLLFQILGAYDEPKLIRGKASYFLQDVKEGETFLQVIPRGDYLFNPDIDIHDPEDDFVKLSNEAIIAAESSESELGNNLSRELLAHDFFEFRQSLEDKGLPKVNNLYPAGSDVWKNISTLYRFEMIGDLGQHFNKRIERLSLSVMKCNENFSNINFVSQNRNINKKYLSITNFFEKSSELEMSLEIYFAANLKNREVIKSSLRQMLLEMSLGEDIKFEKVNGDLFADVKFLKSGKWLNLSDQGYGVISALSMLFSLALSNNNILKNIWDTSEGKFDTDINAYVTFLKTRKILAIEEPEMNLHPNAQSKLADVFAHSVKEHNTTLVIETHSEYLIRRLQYLVAKGELKKEMVQIYYFNDPRQLQEGDERVYPINITEDGSLTKDFGKGFFDEAARNVMDLFLERETNKN